MLRRTLEQSSVLFYLAISGSFSQVRVMPLSMWVISSRASLPLVKNSNRCGIQVLCVVSTAYLPPTTLEMSSALHIHPYPRQCFSVPRTLASRYLPRRCRIPSLAYSFQWVELREETNQPAAGLSTPRPHRSHRFFDSKARGDDHVEQPVEPGPETSQEKGQLLEIGSENILQYAHHGYVYCMLLPEAVGPDNQRSDRLISGGGDGTIKLWGRTLQKAGALCELAVLDNGDCSVFSMALDGTLLYASLLEGEVNVWDLETRQLVRNIRASKLDVLTLVVIGELVFTGAACGTVKVGFYHYTMMAGSSTELIGAVRRSIGGMNASSRGKLMTAWFWRRPLPGIKAGFCASPAVTITVWPSGISHSGPQQPLEVRQQATVWAILSPYRLP